MVDRPRPGHRRDVETELPRARPPFGRLHRHPVGTAEAEGEEGGARAGHEAVTLPAAARVRPRAGRDFRGGGPGRYRRTHAESRPTAPREVLYDSAGGVARITINRPAAATPCPGGSWPGIREALAAAKADPGVRVVVLTGAGDEAFCAGADLGGHGRRRRTEPTTASSSATESRGVLADVFQDLWHLGKPTIARVQGWAMAGGMGLALACDLVVASDRARFGAPEINVGLWPYMITVPLVRSMPPKKALELMLTGRVVGGRGGRSHRAS